MDPDDRSVPRRVTINPVKDTMLNAAPVDATVLSGPGEFPGSDDAAVLEDQKDVEITSKFRFDKVIGRGGMGIISSATQLELGREVAMKRLHPYLSKSEVHQDSFRAEALVLGHLDHPNIVPLYGCNRLKGDDLTLAMKLISGRTWAQMLHGPDGAMIEENEVRDYDSHLGILLNVCNAIAFAHSRDIIHRDIKPENVMVGEFGEVLVMDWGIAVSFRSDYVGEELPHRSNATGLVGTPGYLAPEMAEARGDLQGPWTDVYLLGAVLYEVFAGQVPNQGDTILQLLEAVARGDAPDYPESMPFGVEEICRKAMAVEPADRYQTVAEFRAAVQSYMSHRESINISNMASATLEGCIKSLETDDRGSRGSLYAGFNESIAGFQQSLRLWDGNADAVDGEKEARSLYARAALESGDLLLAEAQLEFLDDVESGRLKREIEQAIKDRDKASMASKTLKRTILSSIILVIVLLVSGGFMLMTMNSINSSIAADSKSKLIERAEEYLLEAAKQSAYSMQLNIGKVKLAIQALSERLESIMAEDYVPRPADPAAIIWGPDIDEKGVDLPGFYEDPEYARTVNGNLEPNPISFDTLSYSVPTGVTPEEVHDQIERCEDLLPLLQTLHGETQGTVKRYWAAFESGLLFLYPGAGNVPEDYSPTNRSRYREALNSFTTTQSKPYQHFGTQQVVITFAKMARDPSGKRFGQMGLHVNVEDLVHIPDLPFGWKDEASIRILQMVPDETGVERLTVVADKEYQVAHSLNLTQYDVMLQPLEIKSKDWIQSELEEGRSGVGRDVIDGEPVIFAFAPVMEGVGVNSYLITLPESVVTMPAESFEETIKAKTFSELANMAYIVVGVFIIVLILLLAVPRLVSAKPAAA